MPLTSLTLFAEKAAATTPDTPRTVVCFGTPRGGTSMVAGAIAGLGVPMGRDLPVNIEDPDFNADYTPKTFRDFVAGLPQVVAARNGEHDLWGWKYPLAARYLGDIAGHLRHPFLVVVARDPVPASLRQLKGGQGTPMEALRARVRMEARNMELVEKLQVPTLVVSYERAVNHPVEFLQELAGFLRVDLPADLTPILDFMKPGEYKLPPPAPADTGADPAPPTRPAPVSAPVSAPRMATAPQATPRLADLLLCVGAQKAGTTWLYNRLAVHPEMRTAPIKELHYFSTLDGDDLMAAQTRVRGLQRLLEKNPARVVRFLRAQGRGEAVPADLARLFAPLDDAWYVGSFREAGRFAMDFTPKYAELPDAGHDHIKRISERRKIIFIMREPLDRALSAVRYLFRDGDIAAASLEDLHKAAQNPAILSRSRYDLTVDMLMRHYPAEDLHFMFYETMMRDKAAAVNGVCDWLGISRLDLPAAELDRRDNPTEAFALPESVVAPLRAELAPVRAAIEARFPEARAAWADVVAR